MGLLVQNNRARTHARTLARTHAHKGMQMNFSEDGRRFDLIEIKMRLWWIEI